MWQLGGALARRSSAPNGRNLPGLALPVKGARGDASWGLKSPGAGGAPFWKVSGGLALTGLVGAPVSTQAMAVCEAPRLRRMTARWRWLADSKAPHLSFVALPQGLEWFGGWLSKAPGAAWTYPLASPQAGSRDDPARTAFKR